MADQKPATDTINRHMIRGSSWMIGMRWTIRGVGLISSWSPAEGAREKSLQRALMIARLQTKMGLHVNVMANACLYSFFNGDERTAHIDVDGKPFWDDSFGKGHKMGCPFTLDFRRLYGTALQSWWGLPPTPATLAGQGPLDCLA